MSLPEVTLEGRLGADPELRFLSSGAAVCSFRVACTERKLNQQTNQWEDGKTIWLGIECWKNLAENTAESLQRGDLVVVTGSLFEESWTDPQTNTERTALKVRARTVSPSLASAVARPQRAQRQGGQPQGGQQQAAPQGQQQYQQAPAQDPWATAPQAPQQGGWGQQGQAPAAPQQGGWNQPAPGYGDTPPF